MQWEDDGIASREGDGWRIGWDALYEMLDGGDYEDVRASAGIPEVIGVVPRLVERGVADRSDVQHFDRGVAHDDWGTR